MPEDKPEGLYDKFVLPRIVNAVCGQGVMHKQRARIVPLAEGDVVELGLGGGLNLAHYDARKVRKVTGIDPSDALFERASQLADQAGVALECVRAGAENIPLERGAADTVVVTYSLCTIPDVPAALAEARRLLRPGGRLLFCEHGLAPDEAVAKWQRRIGPVWSRFGGGCQLDRPIDKLLQAGGFGFDQLEQAYIPGWKFISYNYWGAARPLP